MNRNHLRWVVRVLLLVVVLVGVWSAPVKADRDCMLCVDCFVNGMDDVCCEHFLPFGAFGCIAVSGQGCDESGGGSCGVAPD